MYVTSFKLLLKLHAVSKILARTMSENVSVGKVFALFAERQRLAVLLAIIGELCTIAMLWVHCAR